MKQSTNKKIFGMVTTSKSSEYTTHALATFFRFTPLATNDSFILIDNNNDFDQSIVSNFPRVELRRNTSAQSFAWNMNSVLRLAIDQQADLYFLNNDLIFTDKWIEPLLVDRPWILSPLSNREVQFQTNVFNTVVAMGLTDYLGHEDAFQLLAREFQKSHSGYYNVTVLPFFCVKIPLSILTSVGELDESFGKGGAEDYDYCLRAVLAGFSNKYALNSYLLHFGGKSSWSGVETRTEQNEREHLFRTQFAIKWGMPLLKLILFEDESPLDDFPHLRQAINTGDHKQVVETLMAPLKNCSPGDSAR